MLLLFTYCLLMIFFLGGGALKIFLQMMKRNLWPFGRTDSSQTERRSSASAQRNSLVSSIIHRNSRRETETVPEARRETRENRREIETKTEIETKVEVETKAEIETKDESILEANTLQGDTRPSMFNREQFPFRQSQVRISHRDRQDSETKHPDNASKIQEEWEPINDQLQKWDKHQDLILRAKKLAPV